MTRTNEVQQKIKTANSLLDYHKFMNENKIDSNLADLEKSTSATKSCETCAPPSNTESRVAGSCDTRCASGQARVSQTPSRVSQAQGCVGGMATGVDMAYGQDATVVSMPDLSGCTMIEGKVYGRSRQIIIASPDEQRRMGEMDAAIEKEIIDKTALSPIDNLQAYELIMAMRESDIAKDDMRHEPEPIKITHISCDDSLYSLHEYLDYHEGRDFIYKYPNGEKLWIRICECGQVLSSCGSTKLCRVKSLGELQRGVLYNRDESELKTV